jgi:hypothetical protein
MKDMRTARCGYKTSQIFDARLFTMKTLVSMFQQRESIRLTLPLSLLGLVELGGFRRLKMLIPNLKPSIPLVLLFRSSLLSPALRSSLPLSWL